MNWQAISTIAEVLGAAGVIITVIYLAIQIRQNTGSVQAATEHTLMSQEIEVYALMAAHADVYQRGSTDLASLSKAERIVFNNLMFSQMSQIYSSWVQRKGGFIELPVWQAYENGALLTLAAPGFREAWEENKITYPVEFQKAVADLLRSDQSN
jgi:hypothetical protein